MMTDQVAAKQAAFKTAVNNAAILLSALPERTPQQIRRIAEQSIKVVCMVNPAASLLSVDHLYEELCQMFSVTKEDGLLLDDTSMRGL
ncbi:MAG: hypothetical protein ACK5TO_21075 [Planctomycetaceae bacterium]|jgi:predicted phosphoribosyltransferase